MFSYFSTNKSEPLLKLLIFPPFGYTLFYNFVRFALDTKLLTLTTIHTPPASRSSTTRLPESSNTTINYNLCKTYKSVKERVLYFKRGMLIWVIISPDSLVNCVKYWEMLTSCLSSNLKRIKSIIINYYCKHIFEASLVRRKIHGILEQKINLMFFKFVSLYLFIFTLDACRKL